MSHTKEPWFFDEDGKIWRRHPKELYQNGGGIAGDKPVAICDKGWYGEGDKGYPNNANARRIVACINACSGKKTEDLEAMAGKDIFTGNLFSKRVATEKERDQLRELCGELLSELSGLYENVSSEINQEHRNLVKSVIEKAEKALGGVATPEQVLSERGGK